MLRSDGKFGKNCSLLEYDNGISSIVFCLSFPYFILAKNISQVSFGSKSPALSDREEFPLFFRTVMPDSAHNPARIAFIQYFKWETIATFTQNEEIYSLAINDLVGQLENANISCSSTLSFSESDYKVQLQVLRVNKTIIFILLFFFYSFLNKK
jgi:hypothetical protein